MGKGLTMKGREHQRNSMGSTEVKEVREKVCATVAGSRVIGQESALTGAFTAACAPTAATEATRPSTANTGSGTRQHRR